MAQQPLVPPALKPLLTKRRFWTDCLWETEAYSVGQKEPRYPELKDCKVQLPIADGFSLTLSLDEHLSYFSLDFIAPQREPVNVAWDDQAHWHPHVLRWAELETISRVLAQRDHELVHPGWVVLLLHRFAPICEGDDVPAIAAILEAAWKRLGVFSNHEITTFIERIDASDAGFRWRRVEGVGWCIEQEDRTASARGLYSLRCADNATFPFHDWHRMIEAAGREWAARSVSTSAAAPQPTPPAPQCMPRRKRTLYLTIPYEDAERPVPPPFGKLVSDTLDGALRDLHLGRCSNSGGTSRPNGDGTYTEVESNYFLQLKGDIDEGIRVLHDLLWWSHAPESVKLAENFRANVPLNLTQPPSADGRIILQLARLSVYRWRLGNRFDRTPFSSELYQAFANLLSRHAARAPDQGGWFHANTDDGGRLSVCLRPFDDDQPADAATVVIERLTLEATMLLHRLMAENGLALLPLHVAANQKVAQELEVPGLRFRVIPSHAELYDLLMAPRNRH
jgi:hypothetical protein